VAQQAELDRRVGGAALDRDEDRQQEDAKDQRDYRRRCAPPFRRPLTEAEDDGAD
jgi:hypothetical protein